MIKISLLSELRHLVPEGCFLLLGRYSSRDSMIVIILLLIVSISVAALFLAAFIWSVKSGQYRDEEGPPVRILFDDAYPHSTDEP